MGRGWSGFGVNQPVHPDLVAERLALTPQSTRRSTGVPVPIYSFARTLLRRRASQDEAFTRGCGLTIRRLHASADPPETRRFRGTDDNPRSVFRYFEFLLADFRYFEFLRGEFRNGR
ncbi:hypothetical protein OG800_49855 (plasmid) [Streptomyces sp. NBC_00445]|uniref:hypothetical protein n=1 Tax=Streptomyces sp. NBC_00445 TaxID=2975745 RepID=UPI002E1C33E4